MPHADCFDRAAACECRLLELEWLCQARFAAPCSEQPAFGQRTQVIQASVLHRVLVSATIQIIGVTFGSTSDR
jgi:hypothetical protein